MINELILVESSYRNPYKNLALEEYLLSKVEDDQCILYLWQNRKTIVVGYNQNPWKECLVSKLESDGGHICRRLSGGGAVFHDDGNLNFTFIVKKENYNVNTQLEVILLAVSSLGIPAEKSGRNDILIDGKKFSGNAFYEHQGRCYHHGTLMVNVDINQLSKYLTVSKDKLESKGVKSVKSRVVNLCEYKPELTIEQLKESLKESFSKVYGLPCKKSETRDFDQEELRKKQIRFEDWDYIFGKKIQFQNSLSKRFDWGEVTLNFNVNKGIVETTEIFSDAMNLNLIGKIPEIIKDVRYDNDAITGKLLEFSVTESIEKIMLQDMVRWLEQEEL